MRAKEKPIINIYNEVALSEMTRCVFGSHPLNIPGMVVVSVSLMDERHSVPDTAGIGHQPGGMMRQYMELSLRRGFRLRHRRLRFDILRHWHSGQRRLPMIANNNSTHKRKPKKLKGQRYPAFQNAVRFTCSEEPEV